MNDDPRRREIINACLSVVVDDSIQRLQNEIDINIATIKESDSYKSYETSIMNIRHYQKTITTLKHFKALGKDMNGPTHWSIEDALGFCVNEEGYILEVSENVTQLIETEFEKRLPYGVVVSRELQKRQEKQSVIDEVQETLMKADKDMDLEWRLDYGASSNKKQMTASELADYYIKLNEELKQKEQKNTNARFC